MVSVNLASSYLTFLSINPYAKMEESRRKAYMKAQATKKKQKSSKAMAQAHPSSKRKPFEKVDRPPKKPKVVAEPTVSETAATGKLPSKPGKGKGLMTW